MNISGFNPNFGEVFGPNTERKAGQKAESVNYTGQSFIENMHAVVRSANMQIAGGLNLSSLELSRHKEEFDNLFSYSKTDEEEAAECLERIGKILTGIKNKK